MEKFLVRVGDVFNVEMRIREIDDNYRVFYNTLKKRFEVHNLKFSPNTLVLVSPYEELDSRLVRLVRSSRVEWANRIFEEVEENNKKLNENQKQATIEKNNYALLKIEKMKKLLEKGGYGNKNEG